MLMWFLAALAFLCLGMLLMPSVRRRMQPRAKHDRPLPTPIRLEPAPPEQRIDLDDLDPCDVVEIETLQGDRYRFHREQERDVFMVEIFSEEVWRRLCQATVIASLRGPAVFPRTFALGCSLHIVVRNDDGPAPRRTQALTAVRCLRGRDNHRLS